jgi:translation initiation factor 4B
VPSSPAAPAHAPLATRPKLNLQKRTVSTTDQSPPAAAAASADVRASPFGAARPIDTSAREKEIEEKLRLKKEQEEKAREERRLAKEAEKAQAAAQPQAQTQAGAQGTAKGKSNGQAKEGEAAEGSASGKNYQILRRDEEAGADAATATGGSADAPAIQVAPPSAGLPDAKKANGVDNPASPSVVATQAKPSVDDDGWNTVTKPQKKGKGGRP